MVITAQDTKLRPGYKQTEAGVIPEDWSVRALGQLGEFKNGINKGKTEFGYGFPFVNLLDVFGVIKVSNASEFGLVNSTDIERNIYSLKKGDVLFVRSSVKPEGVGLTTLVAEDLLGTVYSGFLIRFRDRGELVFEFKEHCFGEFGFRKRLIANSTVSANTNINQNALKNLLIAFPPSKEEQTAIATALSNVDALIATLDQLITKKRDIKQATMQQLLTGKRRLPGFSGEWKCKTFGEVMTGFASGATPSRNRPDFFKGDIRWITSGELNYNLIMDTIEKVSVEAVNKTNLKLLPKDTFLMAITGLEAEGTRGSCGIVGAEATTNQSCMALFPTKELSTQYLFHYYVYKGKSLALQYCQGTKQQSYIGKIVKLLPILLPPVEEQQAIANILTDMDAEIAALERKRDKIRALKQGMMQELLTGKTRLV